MEIEVIPKTYKKFQKNNPINPSIGAGSGGYSIFICRGYSR